MQHVPEHIRQELFGILASVFDSVRSARQEKYADTQNMAQEVEAMLPRGEELDELKRRLAVILFPDRYRSPFHGPEFTMESDNNDECDGNPLLDDPNLADLATLVDLKSFGNMALF
ncbi:hypothetical protein PoB_007507700 [Plakobranchus ocellatus]|uniref:Uncharacterized protein n=1 Tax=Plakobranchus ocellatus TaxID=259542 RepID=A0AAV4DW93_9GAST|nr:hypothetical protein PoB_007507700 [Plakobranchus ocellatus]